MTVALDRPTDRQNRLRRVILRFAIVSVLESMRFMLNASPTLRLVRLVRGDPERLVSIVAARPWR